VAALFHALAAETVWCIDAGFADKVSGLTAPADIGTGQRDSRGIRERRLTRYCQHGERSSDGVTALEQGIQLTEST
jgi:hypothetical protein